MKIIRALHPSSLVVSLVVSLVLLAGVGCGQNKFQQEVESEKLAVTLARETAAGEYELITTEELKKLIDDQQDMVLIDAMPYAESFSKEHIPGAKNFLFPKDGEMTDWDPAQTGNKTQEQFAELLGDDKDKLVVVYCGFVKCARSHNGAMWAKKLGYNNVKRYPGGIYAWKGAGHATQAASVQ